PRPRLPLPPRPRPPRQRPPRGRCLAWPPTPPNAKLSSRLTREKLSWRARPSASWPVCCSSLFSNNKVRCPGCPLMPLHLIFPQLLAVLVSVLERVEITDWVKHRVVASFLIVRDLNAMTAGVSNVGTVTAGPAFLAGAVFENAFCFRHLGKALHLRTTAARETDVSRSHNRMREFGLMVVGRAGALDLLHVRSVRRQENQLERPDAVGHPNVDRILAALHDLHLHVLLVERDAAFD